MLPRYILRCGRSRYTVIVPNPDSAVLIPMPAINNPNETHQQYLHTNKLFLHEISFQNKPFLCHGINKKDVNKVIFFWYYLLLLHARVRNKLLFNDFYMLLNVVEFILVIKDFLFIKTFQQKLSFQ